MDEQNQSMDFEQMIQMAKMLSTMLQPSIEQNNEENESQPTTEIVQYKPIAFDEEIQTQDMKIIKSIIPYMNINQQKLVGVFIKFMEIKNILNKKEDESIVVQNQDEETSPKEILMAIEPYCSSDKKNMINIMLRMLELKKILVKVETLKEVLQ